MVSVLSSENRKNLNVPKVFTLYLIVLWRIDLQESISRLIQISITKILFIFAKSTEMSFF